MNDAIQRMLQRYKTQDRGMILSGFFEGIYL